MTGEGHSFHESSDASLTESLLFLIITSSASFASAFSANSISVFLFVGDSFGGGLLFIECISRCRTSLDVHGHASRIASGGKGPPLGLGVLALFVPTPCWSN